MSFSEQERDIKDTVRRAKANSDKSGVLRRNTLQRLIELTHSTHAPLKIIAAEGIPHFFSDFPDSEEAAINAIYDLCEDQSPSVRIQGYSAITQVSRTQNKWVKRNADVLVQLLQSDEPNEVTVVKGALTEHIDMDARITIGVLCDQIVPPEEPLDDEDQSTRDRLRSLVLAFLSGEAKNAIVNRSSPGVDAEDALINGLLAATKKLAPSDNEMIVKDILVSLPSYTANPSRGKELLEDILSKAKASLFTKPEDARSYLKLASFLAIEKQVAPATDLLRYYCTSLAGKINLQKLPLDDQLFIICNTATILVACTKRHVKSKDTELLALQRQVVEATPILLDPLEKSQFSEVSSREACKTLLESCLRRKQQNGWTVPANLKSILLRIANSPGCRGNDKPSQDIQRLIRSLAPPEPTQTPAKVVNRITGKLQSVPPGVSVQASPKQTEDPQRNAPAAGYRRMNVNRAQHGGTPGSSTAGAQATAKRDSPSIADDTQRPPKRQRPSGNQANAGDAAPSLLSRLGANGTEQRSSHGGSGQQPHRFSTGGRTDASSNRPLHFPNEREELTIKGAASKPQGGEGPRPPQRPMVPTRPSLVDRIQGGGDLYDGNHNGNGEPNGRRKWNSQFS